MRQYKGGVAQLAQKIEQDLKKRDTGLIKPQYEGLSDLVASLLTCHSINTSELANVLPRNVGDPESKYRFINRLLKNKFIDVSSVMKSFNEEIFEHLTQLQENIELIMDQSQINKDFQCLMIAVKLQNRAIPVAWVVEKTKGSIGFKTQEILLNKVSQMIPKNVKVNFFADRFYGTTLLINWCKSSNWNYKIRLRGNLNINHQGGLIQTNELLKLNIPFIYNAKLSDTNISTNIGVIQEDGHPEPWIIAMNCPPNKKEVLEYRNRWGIELLFSDMKSRGFNITKTQLIHEDRIERLILVVAIALIWATSVGIGTSEDFTNSIKSKKKFNEVDCLFSKKALDSSQKPL